MDPTLLSKKVSLIPGTHQMKLDYVSGVNPIYVGYADPGVPTSSPNWFIQKITWDANNNPTVIQSVNNSVWDNRASLNYT